MRPSLLLGCSMHARTDKLHTRKTDGLRRDNGTDQNFYLEYILHAICNIQYNIMTLHSSSFASLRLGITCLADSFRFLEEKIKDSFKGFSIERDSGQM
jgi:hypothetical protein